MEDVEYVSSLLGWPKKSWGEKLRNTTKSGQFILNVWLLCPEDPLSYIKYNKAHVKKLIRVEVSETDSLVISSTTHHIMLINSV